MSYSQANGWYAELAAQGEYTSLSYFNVFELGQHIVGLDIELPSACPAAGGDSKLQTGLNFSGWTSYVDCKYNKLIRGPLRPAVVRCWNEESPSCPRQGPNGTTTGLVQSAFNAVVMDPGVPAYREHVLEQARRLLHFHPDKRTVAGIAIDRSDWSGLVNPDRDDGITAVDGKPASCMLSSFLRVTAGLSDILRAPAAGRVMLLNDEIFRADMMRPFDGIYDEYGDLMQGRHMAASAWLGLAKPVTIWFHDNTYPWAERDPVTALGYRHMLQAHLLMGVFPSIPFVEHGDAKKSDAWHPDSQDC